MNAVIMSHPVMTWDHRRGIQEALEKFLEDHYLFAKTEFLD